MWSIIMLNIQESTLEVAKRQKGKIAAWQNGIMAKGENGVVAEFDGRKHRIAVEGAERYQC